MPGGVGIPTLWQESKIFLKEHFRLVPEKLFRRDNEGSEVFLV